MSHLYVLLGEVSTQGLYPFFNWIVGLPVLSRMSSLFILEIKPLSNMSLANTFSHTVSSIFILRMVSLAVQKFFNLQYPICLFFPLCPLPQGTYQWKYCCIEYLRFSCLCSPEGLLWCHDLYLSLLSTLNLFLCVVWVGNWVSFFFLHVAV